jgi:hypothetical protein
VAFNIVSILSIIYKVCAYHFVEKAISFEPAPAMTDVRQSEAIIAALSVLAVVTCPCVVLSIAIEQVWSVGELNLCAVSYS